MLREPKPIDISNAPEILRIVEEVRSTNEPRVLQRAGEDLAVLVPARRARKRRGAQEKTREDYEAFRSAAGGWRDVDTDKLLADIYADRALGDRSPVEL